MSETPDEPARTVAPEAANPSASTADPGDASLSDPALGVPYLSGGIGLSEREEMALVKSRYNLRLLFAIQGSGAYLAGIKVRIADAAGPTLLTAVSKGPWFYANLAPGRYILTLDKKGQSQTREVTIPATGALQEDFYWVP